MYSTSLWKCFLPAYVACGRASRLLSEQGWRGMVTLHFLLQHWVWKLQIGLSNSTPLPNPWEQSQVWSLPFWSSFLFFQIHTLWPTQQQQQQGGFPLSLKREKEKCPLVCRDDLQCSPAEADRMRLWAVPLPSMLLLFKMKRSLRKGRTTRTEMCLAVSACTLSSWPVGSRPFTLGTVNNWTGSWVLLLGQSNAQTWVKSMQTFFSYCQFILCVPREAWGWS